MEEKNQTKDKSYQVTKNIGSYVLGKSIGEGTFGKVKVGKHIHTGEKVAIKILDKSKMVEEEDINRVQKEILILKKLKHKNIIQLYEIIQTKKNIYLIMDFAEGGELFDYISMKKRLPEIEACKFLQEIINGLEYLHQQNYVHRDLKPENLLLDYKKSVKISDFGLSSFYSNDKLLTTPCGTPSYAPPEMLKGEEYHGLFSDIWSCGIILYAMLVGYLPFSEENDDIVCQKIIQGYFEIPDFVSPLAADLIRRILNIDPVKRYDLDQIKSHSWFRIQTPNICPGIIIGYHNLPIDTYILSKLSDYSFVVEAARDNLINNKFNQATATYYLMLRKFIREGAKSISDQSSQTFLNYIKDERNTIKYAFKTLIIPHKDLKCSKSSPSINNLKDSSITRSRSQNFLICDIKFDRMYSKTCLTNIHILNSEVQARLYKKKIRTMLRGRKEVQDDEQNNQEESNYEFPKYHTHRNLCKYDIFNYPEDSFNSKKIVSLSEPFIRLDFKQFMENTEENDKYKDIIFITEENNKYRNDSNKSFETEYKNNLTLTLGNESEHCNTLSEAYHGDSKKEEKINNSFTISERSDILTDENNLKLIDEYNNFREPLDNNQIYRNNLDQNFHDEKIIAMKIRSNSYQLDNIKIIDFYDSLSNNNCEKDNNLPDQSEANQEMIEKNDKSNKNIISLKKLNKEKTSKQEESEKIVNSKKIISDKKNLPLKEKQNNKVKIKEYKREIKREKNNVPLNKFLNISGTFEDVKESSVEKSRSKSKNNDKIKKKSLSPNLKETKNMLKKKEVKKIKIINKQEKKNVKKLTTHFAQKKQKIAPKIVKLKGKNLSNGNFGIISENEEYHDKNNIKRKPYNLKQSKISSVKLKQKDYVIQSKKALSISTRELISSSIRPPISDKNNGKTYLTPKKYIILKKLANSTIHLDTSKNKELINNISVNQVNSSLNFNINTQLDKRVFSTINLTTINTNNSSYRTPKPNTTKNECKFTQNFKNNINKILLMNKGITISSSNEFDFKSNYLTISCNSTNKTLNPSLNKNNSEEKNYVDKTNINRKNSNIPTYNGAIDLSNILTLDYEVVVNNLSTILSKNKISFVKTQNFKFRCSKTGTSFDIEVYQMEHSSLTYLKFKKTQGDFFNFSKLSIALVEQIKSFNNE